MKILVIFALDKYKSCSTSNKGTQAIKVNGVKLPVKGKESVIKIPLNKLSRYLCVRVSFIDISFEKYEYINLRVESRD